MARTESWQSLLIGLDVTTAAPVVPTEVVDVDHASVLSHAGIGGFLKAHRSGPITVVVNDTHRMTDTRPFLAALLAAIDNAFAASSRPPLRALVAAGTHKSDRLERIGHEERMAAPFLKRFDEIAWHDSDDAASLCDVGGFQFHRWMGEGGTYVACGSTEPHYFAGVTGAHKTLTVGVMSRADIQKNHSQAMSKTAIGMKLDGNPIHAGVVKAIEALEKSGARVFALNQVIVDGRVIAATAATRWPRSPTPCRPVRRCFTYPVDEPLDFDRRTRGPTARPRSLSGRQGHQEHRERRPPRRRADPRRGVREGVGIDHFVTLLRTAPTYVEAMMIVPAARLPPRRPQGSEAPRAHRQPESPHRPGEPHIEPDLGAVLGMRIFRDVRMRPTGHAANWPPPRRVVSSSRTRGTLPLELYGR